MTHSPALRRYARIYTLYHAIAWLDADDLRRVRDFLEAARSALSDEEHAFIEGTLDEPGSLGLSEILHPECSGCGVRAGATGIDCYDPAGDLAGLFTCAKCMGYGDDRHVEAVSILRALVEHMESAFDPMQETPDAWFEAVERAKKLTLALDAGRKEAQ